MVKWAHHLTFGTAITLASPPIHSSFRLLNPLFPSILASGTHRAAFQIIWGFAGEFTCTLLCHLFYLVSHFVCSYTCTALPLPLPLPLFAFITHCHHLSPFTCLTTFWCLTCLVAHTVPVCRACSSPCYIVLYFTTFCPLLTFACGTGHLPFLPPLPVVCCGLPHACTPCVLPYLHTHRDLCPFPTLTIYLPCAYLVPFYTPPPCLMPVYFPLPTFSVHFLPYLPCVYYLHRTVFWCPWWRTDSGGTLGEAGRGRLRLGHCWPGHGHFGPALASLCHLPPPPSPPPPSSLNPSKTLSLSLYWDCNTGQPSARVEP